MSDAASCARPPGADHVQVAGELIGIHRVTPAPYETIAVAGDDRLLVIEPAEPASAGESREAAIDSAAWQPVQPMD